MQLIRCWTLVAALSFAVTSSASADCCSDFWSCLTAAATGGQSCSAQAASHEVEALKAQAEQARATATAEQTRLLTLMAEETQRRASEAEAGSLARVRDISGHVARALALPSASDADVKTQTERAPARLRVLKTESKAQHRSLRQKELAAFRSTATTMTRGIRTAFDTSLIAPLSSWLGKLPASDLGLTSSVVTSGVAELERIEREGNAALAKQATEADAALQADGDKLAHAVAEQTRRAEEASTLTDLLEKLSQAGQPSDVSALKSTLDRPPGELTPMMEAPFLASNLQLGTSARPAVSATPATLSPAELAQIDARARAELTPKVTARDPQRAAKKKANLLEQVQRRFGKDPATLEKVLAYIEGAAPAPQN